MSASTEPGDYLLDQSYEAWKNFILILAALLVGDCFANFGQIIRAFLSLTDFDKTYTQDYWPELVAFLVVIYIAKNAHGILITLFDTEYAKQTAKTRIQVVLFYLFTASVILSFSFVLRLLQLVEDKHTLRSRSLGLMLFTFMPSLLLLIFDILHQAFVFKERRVKGGPWIEELLSSPLRRVNHNQFKKIWIIEDLASVAIFVIWLILITWAITSPPSRITVTLFALVLILLINSVIDYILNCNYFFFERKKYVSVEDNNLTSSSTKESFAALGTPQNLEQPK
jgi:hypothetical protein